jgi:DNA-binding response OmpR family regulator
VGVEQFRSAAGNVALFERCEAATGAEAVVGPHLILLNLHRPDLSGLEVCCRLKAHSATRGIPMAFLSALGREGNGAGGAWLSADASFSKLAPPGP